MSIVVLDGTKEENIVVENTLKALSQQNEEYNYFKLRDLHITSCRNCGGCKLKTPGKCIFDDDIDEILFKVIKSSIVIMITPITFGGYSYNLKKALDKFSITAYPTFTMKNGKLIHPPIYDKMSSGNLVIGISNNTSEDEKRSFKKLTLENTCITGTHFFDLIVELSDGSKDIFNSINSKLNEVKVNG